MRFESPLDSALVDELMDLWLPIFEDGIDLTREALLGEEVPHSTITVYTRRIAGKLAGACLVASSPALPDLGGLGEVATTSDARRTGIATALTQQALGDFEEHGGRALFLGTVNPAAARIYHRLGWRKLAGANLMLNVLNRESPKEFIVDYFRQIRGESVSVRTPVARGPRANNTLARCASRLASAGLQHGDDVHSVRDPRFMLGAIPQIRCHRQRWARRMVLCRHGQWARCRAVNGATRR